MALNRLFACLIASALTAGTLSGCDAISGMFGGGGDNPPAAAADDAPKPKRHRPRKKAPVQTASAHGAAGAPGATPPSAAPALKPRAFLYRNVNYDKMRTRAMQMVYEGKTKKALAAFQDAQHVRPTDPAVQMWVAAIRQSAQKARDAAPKADDDFKTAAQQLRTPVLPGVGTGTTTAAPAAGTPAAGAAPTLPRPALPAAGNTGTPTVVDPRTVF